MATVGDVKASLDLLSLLQKRWYAVSTVVLLDLILIYWSCPDFVDMSTFEKEHEPCHEPNLHMRLSCAGGF